MKDKETLVFRKTLQYANGYRELGMRKHALLELDTLSPEQAQSMAALQMRLAIYMDANHWKKALETARALHSMAPEQAESHVNLAFVIRRAQSMETARLILIEAARKFPNEAVIPYNLGCYSCQNREFDEAKSYLEQAFSLDSNYVKMAKKDEDLESLRDWIDSQADKKSQLAD